MNISFIKRSAAEAFAAADALNVCVGVGGGVLMFVKFVVGCWLVGVNKSMAVAVVLPFLMVNVSLALLAGLAAADVVVKTVLVCVLLLYDDEATMGLIVLNSDMKVAFENGDIVVLEAEIFFADGVVGDDKPAVESLP